MTYIPENIIVEYIRVVGPTVTPEELKDQIFDFLDRFDKRADQKKNDNQLESYWKVKLDSYGIKIGTAITSQIKGLVKTKKKCIDCLNLLGWCGYYLEQEEKLFKFEKLSTQYEKNMAILENSPFQDVSIILDCLETDWSGIKGRALLKKELQERGLYSFPCDVDHLLDEIDQKNQEVLLAYYDLQYEEKIFRKWVDTHAILGEYSKEAMMELENLVGLHES